MTFLWPELLWLLVAVPALSLAYAMLLRRKRSAEQRFPVLGIGTASVPRYQRWLPPVLFLAGIAALLIAVARPAAHVTLPARHQTLILAVDVSGSMRASDIGPNRLAAAKTAAQSFVNEQPRDTRIGLVAFAGTALLVQSPTDDRAQLLAAIERFELQRATAVGSAMLVALKALVPDLELDVTTGLPPRKGQDRRAGGTAPPADAAKPAPEPVAPGSNKSAAIVLLTDGQTTTGPDPLEAARVCAERGVRVFTVGFGTPGGEVISFEGWRMRARLDEGALKAIADATAGDYFQASTAAELKRVYRALTARIVLETREMEVSALFAAAGAAAMLMSAFLSLLWFDRIL